MQQCCNQQCPNSNTRGSKGRILCFNCETVWYCSHKCKEKDWVKGHASSCQVNDYQQGELIGQGTYGKVYVAHKNNQIYAMKIIPKGFFNISEEQLQKEIRIHKKLQHENIIKLISVYQDREFIKIILEYANDNQRPDNITYFTQVCLGINYLHTNNIIHRDLKPENILINNGVVKLCDFGWATEVGANEYRDTLCGTQDYMAPEIYTHRYNKAVDMYSLGVILYELFHNSLPSKPIAFNCPQIVQDLILNLIAPSEQRYTIQQVLEHPLLNRQSINIDVKYLNLKELDLFLQLDSIIQEDVSYSTKNADIRKSRITRKSSAQREPHISFFSKILSSFTCINRSK